MLVWYIICICVNVCCCWVEWISVFRFVVKFSINCVAHRMPSSQSEFAVECCSQHIRSSGVTTTTRAIGSTNEPSNNNNKPAPPPQPIFSAVHPGANLIYRESATPLSKPSSISCCSFCWILIFFLLLLLLFCD